MATRRYSSAFGHKQGRPCVITAASIQEEAAFLNLRKFPRDHARGEARSGLRDLRKIIPDDRKEEAQMHKVNHGFPGTEK